MCLDGPDALAAERYGLYDAGCIRTERTADALFDRYRRQVQFEMVDEEPVLFRQRPEFLLVVRSHGEFEEIYNGPGWPVWQAADRKKGTRERSIAVDRLRALAKAIPAAHRLPRRGDSPPVALARRDQPTSAPVEASSPPRAPRMTGSEPLHLGGLKGAANLLRFWQWAYSDLRGEAERRLLAAWIVAVALESEGLARPTALPFDVESPAGIRVVVNYAEFPRTWNEVRLSRVKISVSPAGGWSAGLGDYSPRATDSHVFVFSILNVPKGEPVDLLDLASWKFAVLPSATLDAILGKQESISLSSLLRLEPIEVPFGGLREAIESAARFR